MATLETGVSGKDVETLQKDINALLGKGTIKVTGTFDDKTREKLGELQDKLGVGASGVYDAKTARAVAEAKEPRTPVVIKGKTIWVTAAQYQVLLAKAQAQATKAVTPVVSMANEVKMLWDANKKARDNNWFWSNVVDVATGASFPSKSQVDQAVKAAASMQKAAAAGTLTPAAFDRNAAVVRTAFAAIDQYREETFGGGAQLVKELETIRDAAVVTLTVTSAIATAGASWQIQVGASAGMAAYESALKQIDTASKNAKYSVGQAVSEVFIDTVVDATIGLLMKGGGKGVGNMMDDAAEGAIKGLGKGGKDIIKAYLVKCANGAGQKLIEDGIKGIAGLRNSNGKITKDDLIKAAAKSLALGAGVKSLGPVVDKYMSKKFNLEILPGVDVKIYGEKESAALLKALELAAPKAVEAAIMNLPPKKAHSGLEKAIVAKLLADPKVKKALAEAEKSKDKKKK